MRILKHVILLLFSFLLISTGYTQDSLLLNLESAVAMALNENSDITIADYQIKTGEYAVKEAGGNFLPKLYLSANYNRNLNRQVIFLPDAFGMGGPTKLGSDNDYRASINLAVPVFSNYNHVNKRFAETRLDYQKEAARHTRQKVVNATKKAYFNYLIAQEIVVVRQNQLENAGEILDDIEKRKNRGALTEYDFTAAKVQVAQAKTGLLEAQNHLLPYANTLKLLLGISPKEKLKLTEPISLMENELMVKGNADDMLSQNATLRQLELDIELNQKQVKLAKTAYYPTLDAIGNYNYQAQEDDFNIPDYQWVNSSLIGLQLQISIFNGNITKNKVQQAQIGESIAREQKEYTSRALQMEFEELLSQLDFATQKIAVQLESMNLTEQALGLARKRYEYGKGTFLEVNDAELSYTQARLTWLQAVSEYKAAYYDYQLLIGQD